MMLKECQYCDDAMEHHGDEWECPNCFVCDYCETVNDNECSGCDDCGKRSYSRYRVFV